MVYLILLLLITHLVVLYQLRKYIDAYKLNNHNYLTAELRKINSSFTQGIQSVEFNLNSHYQESNSVLKQLKQNTNEFTQNNTKKFNELTNFIKTDYHSLTLLLKVNNDLLENLIEKTKTNITKNKELKPILESSSEELEKIYGKIKMLISNYEKSLKDVKIEIEDALLSVENITNGKIKQIAADSEKTISHTLEVSKEAINGIATSTNQQLKRVLQDNQIKLLTDKVQAMEEELKSNLSEVNKSISGLDTSFLSKLKELKNEDKDKKGFFGLK